MNPFEALNGFKNPPRWQLRDLDPLPEEEWQRLRHFLQLNEDEMRAMLATVEPLFARGPELVAGTYDYLLDRPETAAILGWERGADPAHLAERRRFFTVWLARLLGMDMSDDLARYLFRAGKKHAAHGPRHTHVPPVYVAGSISLVNATFARFLMDAMPGDPVVPAALAAWNKVLTMHQHLMLQGYQAARALDSGEYPVRVRFFGRLRTLAASQGVSIHLTDGEQMEHLLRKLFNYYPETRAAVFDQGWAESTRVDGRGTPWFEALPIYAIKPMWRVLLNGKDISFAAGTAAPVQPGDEVHLFPPGR